MSDPGEDRAEPRVDRAVAGDAPVSEADPATEVMAVAAARAPDDAAEGVRIVTAQLAAEPGLTGMAPPVVEPASAGLKASVSSKAPARPVEPAQPLTASARPEPALTTGPQPAGFGAASSPSSSTPTGALAKLAENRPELVICAAFVGGLLLATILKRLAR